MYIKEICNVAGPPAWLFVRPINIVTGVLGTRWRIFVFLKEKICEATFRFGRFNGKLISLTLILIGHGILLS